MGIHVSIYREKSNRELQEHSTWDWTRYAGDREIPHVLDNIGKVRLYSNRGYVRPVDVEAFRVALHEVNDFNQKRWDELAEILEDPQWWLYFSY